MTEAWTTLPPHRLDAILAAAEGAPVLVVGDIMLDRYLWGEVRRISPEAPVPVVEVESETSCLGGGANVAQNVRALRAVPRVVAVVGEDPGAAHLREEMERAGLDTSGLVADSGRRTTRKTRIVARGQHVVRADQEDRDEVSGAVAGAILDRVLEMLPRTRVVVLSDYGKGVITRPFLERLLPEARAHGVPVCVDPKDAHFYAYREVAVITPNQHEAAEVLGYKLRTEALVDEAGQELLRRLEPDCVLITRGERGMALFERGGRRTDFPVLPRRVYDVTGAGDTVVSVYAVALAGGAEPREAALMATHAAGLVVSEIGTAVPDVEELRRTFRDPGA